MNVVSRRLYYQPLLQNKPAHRCIHSRAQIPKKSHTRYTPVVLGAGAIFSFAFYYFSSDLSQSGSTSVQSPLSASHFTRSKIISNEISGPNSKLLKVAVPPHLLPQSDTSDQSSPPPIFPTIFSIYIKHHDIQVERPYTPLEGIDEAGQMIFWIKKYPQGEVGRWLHSKTEGETLELRGPVTSWQSNDQDWDEIVMISGGTGITPFYQLFHSAISRQPTAKTRYTLLHSSHSSAELPPPRILDRLSAFASQHPDRFRMQLFVDSIQGSLPLHIHRPQLGRIGKSAIEWCLGLNQNSWWYNLFGKKNVPQRDRKILFLVSGPESMINAIAGPFGRNMSQGPVGGVLGQLGFSSREVRKLDC